ncbi:MAG: hypothetical protein R3F60_06850 [bacterium]
MERDGLMEQVISAFRARDVFGRVQASPAWHDLSEADRVAAAAEARRQRQLEAALDSAGLSSTARAVLARVRR